MFSKLIVSPTITLMLHEPLAISSMQKDYLNVTENETKIMEILGYCPSNEVCQCVSLKKGHATPIPGLKT